MAFSTDNIGKNCYINISEDENIEDNLYGTIIGYYKNTDKNEEYYFVSINGEVKRIYDDSLVSIIEDGSGGSGEVTPSAVVAATGQMTDVQKAQTSANLNVVSTSTMGEVYMRLEELEANTTYTPPELGFGYAVCSTAAATVAKTASISSYALTTGGIVAIKFDNDVPAAATLNITSKGAKAIYYKGAAITAGVIKGGDTATFIYSTYYHLISIDRDERGSDLPTVTTTDNGKFLRVIDGTWAAATVPSAETANF